MPHACTGPDILVKLVPEFVVWKIPASVETQTSPVTPGLTTTFAGAFDVPSAVADFVKVLPPLIET